MTTMTVAQHPYSVLEKIGNAIIVIDYEADTATVTSNEANLHVKLANINRYSSPLFNVRIGMSRHGYRLGTIEACGGVYHADVYKRPHMQVA